MSMADELRGIENGFNLLYGRTPEPDHRYDPIRQDQAYQMQLDPMLEPSMNLNGSTNPSARQMTGQAQPLDEARLRALAGWSQSPEQGGLGVAGPGPAPDRVESLDEHFARQIFPDFKGELSFGDKLRLRDGMMNAIPQMASRREQVAQQAAQLEEQGRQHDMQLLEKAMASPKANVMLEQLSQSPNFRFSKQAGMLSKGLKESDYGSMQAYRQFIPDDVQERFMKGELPPHELSAWIDQARTDAKLNAQEQAKAAIFQRAQNKKPEERTPYEAQIVEERTAKSDLQRADIELKNAQAKKAQREAEMGQPDHSVLNRVHQQLTGGKSYEMGTSDTQSQALKQYAEMNSQGRTNVQMGTVPALKEQADFYTVKGLENLELEQAPKGMTEGQYRNGPYRQLDDKEKDAVVQYKVAQKTVETMNRVADQLITAKTPAQALKQKIALEAGAYTGRNGLASAYQKDRDAFSSRMARLVEVGVLTNTDVTRWSDTFGSFGDTVQTLKAKQALFGEIQDETQRMLKLKLGGKPITNASRSKLDALLDKANQYRSVEDDANILFGGAKK